MFRKIVSSISFSSALAQQLGFYAKRLRKEEASRRVGLVFIALALVVQSLVVFQPPESANATTSNDFVAGGLGLGANRSLNKFLSPYDRNVRNLKDIMTSMGITRQEIAAAQYSSWIVGETYSWGHNPRLSAAQGLTPLDVHNSNGDKVETVWAIKSKYLNGANTRIYGWIGHSEAVGWFAIMQACGNVVTKIIPPTVEPPKKCEVEGKRDLDADDPNCYVNCAVEGKTDLKADDPNCFINCNVPGKTDLIYNDPNCYVNCTISGKTDLKADDPNCEIELCEYEGKTSVPADSILCVPPAPGDIEQSKTVTNSSQGSVDATTVTAQAGDKIHYTISVKNTGGSPITASLSDDLIDSLEYATIADYGGGTFDEDGQVLSWKDITLASGETQARTFTMQIKDTIPATPQGQSDPISYDCRIMNTFGDLTDIKVDCPPTKVIETVVTELPKTGATENMIFGGGILAVVTYFYLRSRQLSKEVRLIRRDVNAGVI